MARHWNGCQGQLPPATCPCNGDVVPAPGGSAAALTGWQAVLGAFWAAAPPADGTVRQSRSGPGGLGFLGPRRPLILSAFIFNKRSVCCSHASAHPCGFRGVEGVPQGHGTAATPPQWPPHMPGRACVTCALAPTSPHVPVSPPLRGPGNVQLGLLVSGIWWDVCPALGCVPHIPVPGRLLLLVGFVSNVTQYNY